MVDVVKLERAIKAVLHNHLMSWDAQKEIDKLFAALIEPELPLVEAPAPAPAPVVRRVVPKAPILVEVSDGIESKSESA